jgi:hypothetical protein
MKRHRHNLFPFGTAHASAKATEIEMADIVTGRKKSYNGCRQVQGIVSQ